MLMAFENIAIISVYIALAQAINGVVFRRIENEMCNLILRCSLHQVSARSKGECILFTITMDGSGSYYDAREGLCNICKRSTTYTGVNTNLGYYIKGK